MRTLWLLGLVAGLVLADVVPAEAKIECSRSSRCADPILVAELRAAVEAECACEDAASRKSYGKCWKPVVKRLAKERGKSGLPKACRAEVTRALANSVCGRPGTVLCRQQSRRGAEICKVTKASKCDDAYDIGVFPSCADACDEIVAVPFPTTVELAAGDLTSLEPDAGDGVLRFAAAPPALDGVGVGSILVGGVSPSTPAGLLRAVLAVERDGERLTLTTAQAPIQLAYRTLHVSFARSLEIPVMGAASQSRRAMGGTTAEDEFISVTQPFAYVLFDGDGDESTMNDQISIDGTVGGAFDFDFGLSVDWGAIDSLPDLVLECLLSFVDVLTGGQPSCNIEDFLPEARVSFLVHPEVTTDTNVRGAAILDYEKDIDLASTTLTPIVVGPLVFVPVADITATLSGGASGTFSTGVHGSALFETSVFVSSFSPTTPMYTPPTLKDVDFGPNDTSVTLHAEAKVGVGGRLNVLLFGVTGPYATALGYGALEANVLETPCWSLHAGIEADLGVKVTSPALPLIGHVTLVDWQAPRVNPLDVELATGECQAPPDQSTLPPGSGPDAMRLAEPTYTPWSRAWSSPVEGALAASPGNGTVFSELQRTIDGHYVRAGYGVQTLTKIDGDGDLVWARTYDLAGEPVRPLRVRTAGDAGLFAVARTVTAPILLMRLRQNGSVEEAWAYDVPLETCNVEVAALVADGAGGAWVTGSCIGATTTFLLHARGATATLRLLGQAPGMRLNVAERVGEDLFLAGRISDGGDALVGMRLRPDASVVWSKRYDGCASATDAIPSAALVGPLGEITIAGSGGAQHNGIILRLLADGSVGFSAFPGFGFGAGSVFLLDSIAELPTTGYVAGGSVVQFTGSEPENVPSAALVGLGADGRILWANRYTFGAPGSYEPSGHVAVRLSDDGGVLATALARDAADPLGGRLWAIKPFARDGDVGFLPGAATRTALGIVDLPCAFTASDRPLDIETRPVGVRRVAVASTPAGLTTTQQTAE